MKLMHRFFGSLMVLLVLGQGLFALYGLSPMGRARWELALRLAGQDKLLVLLVGVALLLLTSLYLLTFSRGNRGAETLSYAGPNGPVTISMRAVRDFVHRVGSEFPEVISMQSKLDFRRNALHAELDVRVTAGAQLPELCRMLQERVAESLHEQLGLPLVKPIRVNVRELLQRPEAPGPEPEIVA